MDTSKEALRLVATSSNQPELSSKTSSSSKSLTMSKQTSIGAFLTSRRRFLPNHAADVRVFFNAIRTYEDERAARQQKITPANGRPGKLVRRGKESAQRFSTPPMVIFQNPALQTRRAVQTSLAYR